MKCLLDMDGVLVDFVGGALAAHQSHDIYALPENRGRYGIDEIMGLSANQFWKPCNEEFWATLPPMPDWQEILSLVESRFGIENICLLTSPSVNEGCATGKIRWIYKHLPDYKRRFLIGPRKEFCAHVGSILIDDYDANVDGFRKSGGRAVLVPRRWNSLHEIENTVEHLRGALC